MATPHPSRLLVLAIAAGLIVAASCAKTPRQTGTPAQTEASRPESAAVAAIPEAPPDTAVHQPFYRVVKIPDPRALRRLYRELGSDRFLLALKVNRRDSLH